jgi:hypothetical protein
MATAVVLGARVLVGLVLSIAFVGKLSSRSSFREFCGSLRNVPGVPAAGRVAVAAVITATEGISVVLLIVPATVVLGLGLSALLFVVFTIAPVVAMAKGRALVCRCFGVRNGVIGKAHLVRNVVLLAVAVAGLVTSGAGRGEATGVQILAAVAAGALGAVALVAWDELTYVLGGGTG